MSLEMFGTLLSTLRCCADLDVLTNYWLDSRPKSSVAVPSELSAMQQARCVLI